MAQNMYTMHSVTQALSRQRKKLNANAFGKKAKKRGNKCLWQKRPRKKLNTKVASGEIRMTRRNNTNASVKQKMAALMIPGKQTDETT